MQIMHGALTTPIDTYFMWAGLGFDWSVNKGISHIISMHAFIWWLACYLNNKKDKKILLKYFFFLFRDIFVSIIW